MIELLARSADYTEQASVTNWPGRIALVVVMLVLIGLALWGMRRGWVNRQRRQQDIPAPAAEPEPDASLGPAVEGLFLGTGRHGDWMDRIAVHELGVRSRALMAWGPSGIWFDREGARSVFVPADDVVAIRADRGVAGTVRARDSVIVVTWVLGPVTVDTGFRADDTADHSTVLDGLMATFARGVQ